MADKTTISNKYLNEIGISSITLFNKEVYRDMQYMGTYLIRYTDGIDSWGDGEEFLRKIFKTVEDMKKDEELSQ